MNAGGSFGQWVKQRRKALGLTQHEFARQIGCALSTIQKIEIDDRQPSRPMAELLADYLHVDHTERDDFLHLARSQPTAVVSTATVAAAKNKPIYNLPAPLTGLIGREWEVATLVAQLLQPDVRLLTITGPPGVGKTHLSLQVANALRQHFVDGLCFVTLAPISAARFAPTAILRALGLTDAGGQPPMERLKVYLRDKELLLILDNFEHLLPAAPYVVELLEAAVGLKILVTSRALLQLYGEHEFVAPPLALPSLKQLAAPADLIKYAAVDLFVTRAHAARLDFALNDENARAVAGLCIQLDGLPLALELAAARSKQLSPAAMLARLQHPRDAHGARLDLLTGSRQLPPRQQTLRDAIAWSYDLLTPTEQRVFRCLGVFTGGCTLDALQAVLAHSIYAKGNSPPLANPEPVDDTWLQATLDSLVNQSLVFRTDSPDAGSRFGLLEILREYALEQLEQEQEAELAHRTHAEHYLQVAERFREASAAGTITALLFNTEAEIDNLRAGLQWAREHDYALEVRFAAALAEFWSQRRQMSEGRQWLEYLLPRLAASEAQMLPDQLVQYAYLAGMLAFFTWLHGDNTLAQHRWEQAIALWRKLQNRRELGLALHFLVFAYYDRGNYAAALAVAQESVAVLRAADETWALGWALCAIGNVGAVSGDYVAAQAAFEEALVIFHTMSDAWSISLASLGISEVFFARGEYARARAYLEDALHTFRQDGQLWFVAQTLCVLGKVCWRQGERHQSVALWQESLALGQEVGGRRYMAEAAFMLGLAAQEKGDRAQAQAFYTQSQEFYQAVENPIGAAYALCGLASLELKPEQRTKMLTAAATVLEMTRLPFDQIERKHYEKLIAVAPRS